MEMESSGDSAADSLQDPLVSDDNDSHFHNSADAASVELETNCPQAGADESSDNSETAGRVSFLGQLRRSHSSSSRRFSSDEDLIPYDDDDNDEVNSAPKVVSGWNTCIRRHCVKLLWSLCLLWPLGAWSFHLLEQRTDSTFHPIPNTPSQLAIDAFKRSYPQDWSTNPALYVVLTSNNAQHSLTYKYSDAFAAASKWSRGLNQTLDDLNIHNNLGRSEDVDDDGADDGNSTNVSARPWIKMVSYYDLVDQNLKTLAGALVTPHGKSVICQVQYLVNNSAAYHQEHEMLGMLVETMQDYARMHSNISDPYFDVGFTGLKFFSNDLRIATHQDLRRMDMLVLPLALLLIGYVLPNARAAYVWIIPLVTMISTVACWSMVLNQLAHYMQITQFTPSIMMSLTLGMGIDYTLFLLARYLEVVSTNSRSTAILYMLRHGGHVLVLSGLTLLCVFLGLCCLPLSMLQSIGVGCAVAISCALVVNLTLVPALLYTRIGDWIVVNHNESLDRASLEAVPSVDDSERFADDDAPIEEVLPPLRSIWFRMSKQLLHKYRGTIILLVACQLLIPVAIFSGQIKSSLSFDLLLPQDSPSMEVFQDLGEQVGEGKLNPYRILFDGHDANISMTSVRGFEIMHSVLDKLIAMDLNDGDDDDDGGGWGLQQSSKLACSSIDVSSRSEVLNCLSGASLNSTNGKAVAYTGIATLSNIPVPHWSYVAANACVRHWAPDPCPLEVMRAMHELDNLCTSYDEYSTFVSATLPTNPFNDDGMTWLEEARLTIANLEDTLDGVHVHIDGPASVAHDAVHAVHGSFFTMILTTTVIVFVLMGCFFRSVFTPLRSVVSIGLTLGFSFGWTVLVFQKGILSWTDVRAWTAVDHELCWLVPVMSFSMVVGLALDYDVFLMSRIWEYRCHLEYEHRSSIAAGLHSTGGIITAAGCIMALAFGSLGLSSSPVLVQWSCVITTAVLLDTYVIRTLVVPILTALAGDYWCWWPHKQVPSGRRVFEAFRNDADITDFVRALEASSEYEPLRSRQPSEPAYPPP